MARHGPIRDPATAALYGRALIAVVRSDGDFGLEEGLRLGERLARRTGGSIETLLLAPPLRPAELASAIGHRAGPFREAGLHPLTLAAMLVVDAMAVVLAKGHVSAAQAATLIEFATALGCAPGDLARQAPALRPWLPPA